MNILRLSLLIMFLSTAAYAEDHYGIAIGGGTPIFLKAHSQSIEIEIPENAVGSLSADESIWLLRILAISIQGGEISWYTIPESLKRFEVYK